jgi:hypothetical protein
MGRKLDGYWRSCGVTRGKRVCWCFSYSILPISIVKFPIKGVFALVNEVEFMIKYVYPDWFLREDKDREVGFSNRYANHRFPVGGKVLTYVIEHQLIVGAYQIVGEYFNNKNEKQHPLRLPIKKIFRMEEGDIPIEMVNIRRVVPHFKPDQTRSYFPITEDQYNTLENMLIKKQTAFD